mgnify:CR=1 FL=1
MECPLHLACFIFVLLCFFKTQVTSINIEDPELFALISGFKDLITLNLDAHFLSDSILENSTLTQIQQLYLNLKHVSDFLE